jgi:putative transposase
MGSVGDCYDNAVTESFFATLECELLDRHIFRTQAQARTALFAFIEGFYNTQRRHSALGYRSPAEFERHVPYEAAVGKEPSSLHGNGPRRHSEKEVCLSRKLHS